MEDAFFLIPQEGKDAKKGLQNVPIATSLSYVNLEVRQQLPKPLDFLVLYVSAIEAYLIQLK